ncbi:hypothetical protein REPUB_Repub03eG0197500 [Reevesia pubescens]
MDPPMDPNLTPSDSPVKNHGEQHFSKTNDQTKPQSVSAETNPTFDQQGKPPPLQQQSNGYEQKQHPQPQQPEGAVNSPEHLPVPDGYPPFRPPAKLDPPPKKGWIEKICCCCF